MTSTPEIVVETAADDEGALLSSPTTRNREQQSGEEAPNFRHVASATDAHHQSTQLVVEEMKMEEPDSFLAEESVNLQKKKQPQNHGPSPFTRATADSKNQRKIQDDLIFLTHRSKEQETVLRSYESMWSQDGNNNNTKHSLLLIQGASGCGKTRLVQRTLQERVVVDAGGYFLTGKFDLLQRPEPYRAFVSAFTEFTSQVVERGPAEVTKMRDAIVAAVGDECCVLTSMIPSLARILSGDPDSNNKFDSEDHSNAKAEDAIQRFVFVFRMFMRAVCSLDQPMVLLLVGLHFADPCSLDVLTSLVNDLRNIPGLFLVATCDDDINTNVDKEEVGETYLSRKLRDMEKGDNNAPITRVFVRNLNEGEVSYLLGNALQLSRLEQSEGLGKIVCGQTKGNLFYIIEFIRWLQDSGLLSFENGTWFWDAEEIAMTINVKHIGDFLVDKLEQLPTQMRDVLKVAACLGFYVEQELIEFVLDYPTRDILADAASHGILAFGESRGQYRFEHDGIQQAAYSLIPSLERELFHLEVGRRLWRRLNKEELDRNIFVLLSQMNIGKRLITRENERYAIASLCLHAGRKAAKSSTFRTAAVYVNLGIELLGERGWRDDYDLTLALFNAAAEMELCIANYETMESLIDSVLKHARRPGDTIQARATQIYAMGVTDRQRESIELGIEILKGFGETFPRILCKAHLKREIKSVKRLLRGMSNEKILRLPFIDSEEKLACMKILNLIFLNALLARPKLSPFISLKMMKLTLKHGLSMLAPLAFCSYGMICISAMSDVDAAFRFGEIALALLVKLEVREYLPRVYAAVYGCIYPWKKPLRSTLEPLLHANRVGMISGDIEYSSLNANLFCFSAIDAGIPLGRIETDWKSFQETMVSHRQEALLRMSWPCLQAIHHFRGLSPDPLAAQGDLVNYDDILREAEEQGALTVTIGILLTRMRVAYVFNDYELADTFAKRAGKAKAIWTMPPTFEMVSYSFMTAMVALAMAAKGKQYIENVLCAKRMIRTFHNWCLMSPQNCADKKFLLQAELAFLRGKDAVAFEKYTCAIALAKDNGFIFNQALATERVARFFFARDKRSDALTYFRQACSLYTDWGGTAKASRLKVEVNGLYELSSTEKSVFDT